MSLLELLSPAQAWASAAAEAEHHAPPLSGVLYPAINFILYAAVLYYFAVPLVRDFLRTRRNAIIESIAEASRRMQQAEALVSEYKAKLAGAAQEARGIETSLRQEGESEKAKLLGEAQQLAVKIKDDSRFLADQELKIARQRLREELAAEAEATAEDLFQKNITAADQGRLASQFIDDIGQAQ